MLQKLRLLVLTRLFPPAVGGASELFRMLTEAWEQDSAVERVIILTARDPEDSLKYESKGKTIIHRILPATHRGKIGHALIDTAGGLLTYALLTAAAIWYGWRQESLVIIVHGRFGRKAFLRTLKLLGATIVVILSDNFRPPECLSDCHAVICVTENVYERARSTLLDSCHVHYVPLPFQLRDAPSRMASAVISDGPYILFVGEISRWKGVDVLLEAFATFRHEEPEYRLVLAGPICDSTLVAGAESGVSFLGELNHRTILSLIENAEALVLPSRSEGLPRVCLEAIALGTKAICPPGVPELWRACPDWVLPHISTQHVLEKLRQSLRLPFHSSYEIENHDPHLVGHRIIEICASVLADEIA